MECGCLRVISTFDCVGLWPTELCELVENVAGESRFDGLGICSTGSHPVAKDRFESEERVLSAGLPMVARFLLPLPSTDLADPANGSISN